MMGVTETKRRIILAYYLDGWRYEGGDQSLLRAAAEKIVPSDYVPDMEGNIFCPQCHTNLNRVPKYKDHFSNGREAYFAHLSIYKKVNCDLRSTKPQGKRYDTYEEARKAIDDQELVIVNEFIKDKPKLPKREGGVYDETPVEYLKGPKAEVPISRHSGESFKLPSIITTVMGICRNLDKNRYKYYVFPGQKCAVRLVDLLHDVKDVTCEDNKPKLYYGVIKSSSMSNKVIKKPYITNPTSNNIRFIKLFCHSTVKDFYFKEVDMSAQKKGINDHTKDQIIVMYGKVTTNGIGLCIERLGWGEYALLPKKYSKLLLKNT